MFSRGLFRAVARLIAALAFLYLSSAAVFAQQPDLGQLQAEAEAGDPWAQLNLGAAFDHGVSGATQDARLAVYWYRLAAQQGLDKAQFNLAHCLATGNGVSQDYTEARLWMHKAAQQGMADAQFLLGVMQAKGLGGVVDPASAQRNLERAANQGQADAGEFLQELISKQ